MPKNAADAIIDLYQENASAWVNLRMRGQPLFEQPWLDRFLALTQKGERNILDLGCGSGRPIAEYFIAKACQITGVDGAVALTDIARETFPEHTWVAADMRNLPSLEKFHGVIAWHSFFHLKPEDQRPMFETFSRLCFPGAPLMFTSGTSLGEAIGTFEGQPLYHGSLEKAEYRCLLQENGFDVVEHIEEDPTCGGATVWLAQKMSNVG
ncbi:class I SAM-dependent DNA methyltransferase [Roseicitreum antarcticum]|uniref:Methyltransferase domain-containing protein n=1 Tax=Roseicitreum antarcticum TaxID=564137 RepID=A0A1H3F523_9RHOB|nr:class I SAM-dependent methyltransferase [Roseicitreum antarcticum]SDX86123.1 Methyltransferase domain-containing protein [Roseicitreum antarcticum]